MTIDIKSFRRLALTAGVIGIAGLTSGCDPYPSADASTAKIVDVLATDANADTPPELTAPTSNTVTFALTNTDNGACKGTDAAGAAIDPVALHDFTASYDWPTIRILFSNQLDGTTVQSSDPNSGFPCTPASNLTATGTAAGNAPSVCYNPQTTSYVSLNNTGSGGSYVIWTPEVSADGTPQLLQPAQSYALGGTVKDAPKHSVPFSMTVTTEATPAVPCSPSSLSVKAASATAGSGIKIAWSDNSKDETNYVIARGASATGPFTVVKTVDFDTGSFTDKDVALVSGTTYCYQVTATNSLGSSGPAAVGSSTTNCAVAP